ncbi:MAG: tetratricopeptide repeat protein [Alistipes sp.]|nr:tetratricopeptide repeat protein [Alistipes sp.]
MKKFVLMAVAALFAIATVSAQSNEVIAKYGEAVTSFQSKAYAKAASLFEGVIRGGMDSEDSKVLQCVNDAKKNLPTCYYMMGGMAIKGKKYDEALTNFTKSAEKAELYGDTQATIKAKNWIARVYQVQGGEAFNAEDYATAATVFAKGYAANPRNTAMALNLAESYFKLNEYQKGMDICNKICKMNATKYAEPIAAARQKMSIYTNNEVARMQQAGDHDGIIAMAEQMLTKDANSALAQKIRIQAYSNKKQFDKVIELGAAAVAAQTTDEEKSDVYFILGAAFNEKFNAGGSKDAALKAKAVSNLKLVTAGPCVEPAKTALAELSK